MYKAIIPLYIICFGLYILFSRHPDYFDGEIVVGTVQQVTDSTGKTALHAFYRINRETYDVPAKSLFKTYVEGERVELICEASAPSEAVIYNWNYWLSGGELLASIALPIVFLFFAKAITGNPTPEALVEEMEDKSVKRRKYTD